MESASTNGVLTHLSFLEVRARSRRGPELQRSRATELRGEAEELRGARDQLEAEIRARKELQASVSPPAGELLPLMHRHSYLKQRLHVHHLIGGFDAVRTRQGRAVCVSVQTAYEGVFLESFNLELEMKPRVRIGRHNIPPFIPLQSLAGQSRLQTDGRAFLSTLSQHLNAYAGRRRQLQLVQELHRSVEVMESNLLCSVLVLLFTTPPEKTPLLCTLEYADLGSCLPSRVQLDCEDGQLPESPEWRSCCATLRKTPLHRALAGMRKSRTIL